MAKTAKHHLPVQIKEISEDGSFEGLLAVYNNVDLGKDMVEPGAFTKTIQEHGSVVPMLWQHKQDEPIGELTLIDGPDALRIKGQLLMTLPMAQKAYALIKARIIKGLSIGYDTIKDSVENGVRHLKELRLWEGSIVTFPMNEAAMITTVKSITQQRKDFDSELAEIQLQDAEYQLICALCHSLYCLPWSDATTEEKIAAAEIVIQQFHDAYMAFIPLYLDYLTQMYGDSTMQTMSAKRRETKQRMERLTKFITLTPGAGAPLAIKAGARFSAATKDALKAAHGHVKDMDDIFNTLFAEEADDDPEAEAEPDEGDEDTLKQRKAAMRIAQPEGRKADHSAAENLLDNMRSLIPRAKARKAK
jgi:HK97 family phage prohead protease